MFRERFYNSEKQFAPKDMGQTQDTDKQHPGEEGEKSRAEIRDLG